MIDIQELKTKTYEEVSKELEERLNAFKDELSKVNDNDTLTKMEEELMAEQKEFDEYMKTVEYTLPEAVEFDNERFTKNDVAKFVIEFLNRSEVDWQFTLGLFDCVKFWKNTAVTAVTYGIFDTTLRLLNNLRFKGYTDWRNILVVNEYMKACHEPYSIDTAYIVFINQRHQEIMNRTTMITTIEPITE